MSEHERQRLGNRSEELVCQYLAGLGFEIVERNATFKVGEIDIVAREGDTLVFVEVRSRSEGSEVHPAATVNRRKQRQIIKAALAWCQNHRVEEVMLRFDVAAVFWPQGRVELIRNAFEAGR
ncbi:MAG: YraN family protein [Deltaproteobacteria bacterium]|nr:MAG: YraN family protein [Deltaproteobacteria bacterium]